MADLRLMAVHAHPDDESSKGAATLARYAAEGADVLVVTCTGGERGAVLNPAMNHPAVVRDLPAIRQQELSEACSILGVRQTGLGFVDSGMDDHPYIPPAGSFAALDCAEAARRLVRLIRSFRPQVVVTYDEEGGYPHPDHLMCHRISVLAFEEAAAPSNTDLGTPWAPAKLYFHGRSTRRRMRALHGAMLTAGLESRFEAWLRQKGDRDDRADRITTSIACGEYFEARDLALRAHATQTDPHAFWLDVPPHVQRTVWPTEEFELAVARIPVELPETDLFAGVRDPI